MLDNIITSFLVPSTCGRDQGMHLTLLAYIESVLHRRVGQGQVQTRYTFEQLAAELTTGVFFGDQTPSAFQGQ